jgi:ABC-type multidrug transport system fused ATPase/permease subunit
VPALSIKLTAIIIDKVANVDTHPISHHIFLLCGLWAGFLFLKDLFDPIVLVLQANIADKIVFRIGQGIISKSNAIEGLEIFESPNFHDTIQLLQSQAHYKPLNLVVTLAGILRDLVVSLTCFALLMSTIYWVGLLALICSYLHFKIFSSMQEKTWQESLHRTQKSREMMYLTSTTFNAAAAKEIRLFNAGQYILNTYHEIFRTIYHNVFRMRIKQILLSVLPLAISSSSNLIAFGYIINQAIHGEMTIGAIALTLQSLIQLQLSIALLGEQAGWMRGHVLFFKKYFEFLNYKEKLFKRSSNHHMLINLPIEVEFVGVCFHYPNGSEILTNISFKLKSGEKLALVGENGSGKSTLIKLFCGLYAPSKGKILINGIDMKHIHLPTWRKHVAPVFQDFYDFHFTVEKNITLSADTTDKNRFKLISNKIGISDLLNNANQKLGKIFGGSELSGGQWQKLAIARALYKDAEIYILDEPTASLDPLAEYDIYKQFVLTKQYFL